MRFPVGEHYVRKQPGIRAWWRRWRCRLWYGSHKFNKKPTQLYDVKCQYCDDKYHVFDIPIPPMRDELLQECPHCHNIAYGGNGKPYRCKVCHRESQEGAGRPLSIHYR